MIPTAEEWLEHFKENVYPGTSTSECMIEFAKLHVTAALKAASKEAEIRTEEIGGGLNIEWKVIDKESILNAYPLTNIK